MEEGFVLLCFLPEQQLVDCQNRLTFPVRLTYFNPMEYLILGSKEGRKGAGEGGSEEGGSGKGGREEGRMEGLDLREILKKDPKFILKKHHPFTNVLRSHIENQT